MEAMALAFGADPASLRGNIEASSKVEEMISNGEGI
jgi:hypothetical protein